MVIINFSSKPLPIKILDVATIIRATNSALSPLFEIFIEIIGSRNSIKKDIKKPELQPIAPRAKKIFKLSIFKELFYF